MKESGRIRVVGARVENKSRHRNPPGKTKLWNAEGRKPGVADALTRAAQKEKEEAVVWRGDLIATIEARSEGLRVPVGHPEYIASELAQKAEEQSLLFERIPLVEDLQAAWLLLTFCAATRANSRWTNSVIQPSRQGQQPQSKTPTGPLQRESIVSNTPEEVSSAARHSFDGEQRSNGTVKKEELQRHWRGHPGQSGTCGPSHQKRRTDLEHPTQDKSLGVYRPANPKAETSALSAAVDPSRQDEHTYQKAHTR